MSLSLDRSPRKKKFGRTGKLKTIYGDSKHTNDLRVSDEYLAVEKFPSPTIKCVTPNVTLEMI